MKKCFIQYLLDNKIDVQTSTQRLIVYKKLNSFLREVKGLLQSIYLLKNSLMIFYLLLSK